MIIGPIAVVVFSYEQITGTAIGMPHISILGRVLIVVATFTIALILAYRSLWLKMRLNAQDNWITKYEMEHGELPKLPFWLNAFVGTWSGPISKEIVILTPSGQALHRLGPEQSKDVGRFD